VCILFFTHEQDSLHRLFVLKAIHLAFMVFWQLLCKFLQKRQECTSFIDPKPTGTLNLMQQ
jgi:hypothetical protein